MPCPDHVRAPERREEPLKHSWQEIEGGKVKERCNRSQYSYTTWSMFQKYISKQLGCGIQTGIRIYKAFFWQV